MSLVQTHKPSGTFSDYAASLFERVLQTGLGYHRIDVVFDVYDEKSIKSAERARRGEQKMCSIKINRGDVRIPKNWRAFLSNIENKNELVSFLIATWQTYTCKVQEGLTLVLSGVTATIVTHELVQSSAGLISNHDEADTRLILHAADALRSYDLAVIRSVDTDVLVIGIHHFNAMVGDGGKDVVMHMGM